MMKPTIFSAAVIALCGMANSAIAAETIYSCNAIHMTKNGVVGPKIIFFVDDAKGSVRVLDGIIQSVEKAPINAEVTKRSDTLFRLKWTVEDIQGQGATHTASYSGLLNRSKKTYTQNGILHGYDNKVRAEGRCEIVK